jgi:transposase
MVALFSLSGAIEQYRVQKGALTGADFACFVQELVVPNLSAGDVVVLDNARCHRVKRVRELIESVGARVLFLPAYSPDFSPIELAWRKVKASLREAEARTQEQLLPAIDAAMQGVTVEDAQAFYVHCGYGTPTKFDAALQS